MEFLVMPQFTGSLIECYSADGDSCSPFICTCNGDSTLCGCNNQNPCSCNNSHFDCPCYGVYSPPCSRLHCGTDCPIHVGVSSNNPQQTI